MATIIDPYNSRHHAMLIYCLYKGDLFLWNDWRKLNTDENIYLYGANLQRAMLDASNFEEAELMGADLQGAKLVEARLQGASLAEANLQGADLTRANLQGAGLRGANLQEAKISEANFKGADLTGANLQGAKIVRVNLQEANISDAKLQGATFAGADFTKAQFCLVHMDGSTVITCSAFDKNTDFAGAALDAAIIDPDLKAAFKNNIRRMKWSVWEKGGKTRRQKVLRNFVHWFWQLSDYGSSTGRILKSFFALAFGFGVLYWLFALPRIFFPNWEGIVHDLWQGGNGWIGCIQSFIRSIYFSIVTMTTLGFGDMASAKSDFCASILGNIFLSVQVIMGYVLLGALVTRLGILFTSEAPAAEPTPYVWNSTIPK